MVNTKWTQMVWLELGRVRVKHTDDVQINYIVIIYIFYSVSIDFAPST